MLSCRFPSLKDRASVWVLVVLRDCLSAWFSSSSTDITWPHGAPHRATRHNRTSLSVVCIAYLTEITCPGLCYLSRCVFPVQMCATCPGLCYLSRCVLPVQVCVTCTAECRNVARRLESMLTCAVFPSAAS